MGDESPAVGGDNKPDANNNNDSRRGGGSIKNKKNKHATSHDDKFTGQKPELRLHANRREDAIVEDVILCCVNQPEELIFHQSDSTSTCSNRSGIPDTWMLLDSQSTIDIFCNKKLLKRIYKSTSTLTIRCNAGVRQTNLWGYVSGYGWVWYYPDGIANILSLSRVKEQFRVTFDSRYCGQLLPGA